MRRILMIFLILWTSNLIAQEEPKDTTKISFGAYADGYYSYYSNGNSTVVQQHDCIGAYHNNFGLNIGQVTGSYESKKLRGVLTVHFGDIPQIAWGGQYRNLQEANAGVRLRERLWLDVGFFKTHVGTESFLPKDNMMSIITLGTFYGPFYQSGARLSYDTKSEWHFELHAINGYNLHVDNNKFKTFGMLISKEFNDKFGMSYSNMLGQERVGGFDDYLVYQNIYANIALKKLDIQVGLDVAPAYRWKLEANPFWTDPLVAGLFTMKYKLDDDWAFSLRGEIFHDPEKVNSDNPYPIIVTSATSAGSSVTYSSFAYETPGLSILGGTIGVEYSPVENGFIRLESRALSNSNAAVNSYPAGFNDRGVASNPMLESRVQVLLTAGFYFDKTFKFAK